jgi:hypothetical protein
MVLPDRSGICFLSHDAGSQPMGCHGVRKVPNPVVVSLRFPVHDGGPSATFDPLSSRRKRLNLFLNIAEATADLRYAGRVFVCFNPSHFAHQKRLRFLQLL